MRSCCCERVTWSQVDSRCCQRCIQSETCIIGAVRGDLLSGEQRQARDTANSANYILQESQGMGAQCAPILHRKGDKHMVPPYLLDTGWEDFLSL